MSWVSIIFAIYKYKTIINWLNRAYIIHRINTIPLVTFTAKLRQRKTNVDEADVDGAAGGIVRLFSEYRYANLSQQHFLMP